MTNEAFVAVIDEVARTLSATSVAALVAVLADAAAPSARVRLRATSAVPVAAFAAEAGRLVDAWGDHASDLSGKAVALALRTAARTADAGRASQSIDVVWTGPTTTQVPVRLTRAVLLEVIRSAHHQLLLVSFAAYRVQVVLDELAAAAARGVAVRLILESTEESAGALTHDAAKAFSSVRDRVSFYIWPAERRPKLTQGTAKLHAKGAIADDHTAFVTSANLTEHAITENMELGLLVRGGIIPRRLRDHFRELIATRILTRID